VSKNGSDRYSVLNLYNQCRQDRIGSSSTSLGISQKAKTNSVIFMSTQSGYVGWASHTAEAGDGIYIFPGCSVPIVLRRRAEGGHTVVGYAYVQGVMDGELMQPDWKSRGRVGSPEMNWVDLDIY
jgi:hypothetical protein